MLHIYDSLEQKKRRFKPVTPNQVKLYLCGMTVYDDCHIGHARLFLVFDMVVRYFRYLNYAVTYIRNITDIDDKIIQRAQERAVSCEALSEQYIHRLHEDLDRLGLIAPTVEPRATHYIDRMVTFIERLIEQGFAYVGRLGDVYYDVGAFKNYGALSQQNLADLQSGIRVEVQQDKKGPLDFVLWKQAKPGEPAWDSPWGAGRPGWHIECSVMSLHNLGESFDIHGGGHDLKFPHHENERAQSEALTKKKMVNHWMHVGFVQKDREKMSKSLGNFLTLRNFLEQYDPEVLRYFTLASHYRSPIEYTLDHLTLAQRAVLRLYLALRDLDPETETSSSALPRLSTEYEQRFRSAMNDDFNTPEALAVLAELVRETNSRKQSGDKGGAAAFGALLKKLSNVLGLLLRSPEAFLKGSLGAGGGLTALEIDQMIEARETARKAKNWAEADRLREQLRAQGIILEDGAFGTLWRKQT